MSDYDPNDRNRGSTLILFGLLILVSIVVLVYGMTVSAGTDETTEPANPLRHLDEDLPEKLKTLENVREKVKSIEELAKEMKTENEKYKDFIEAVSDDMVELNQTITSR